MLKYCGVIRNENLLKEGLKEINIIKSKLKDINVEISEQNCEKNLRKKAFDSRPGSVPRAAQDGPKS